MNLFSDSFTISKRLLGWLLFLGGLLGTLGLLVLDTLRGTENGGMGPAQRIAIALMIVLAVVGLTLIPLGKRGA